jgi:hypothetical protein
MGSLHSTSENIFIAEIKSVLEVVQNHHKSNANGKPFPVHGRRFRKTLRQIFLNRAINFDKLTKGWEERPQRQILTGINSLDDFAEDLVSQMFYVSRTLKH